MVEELSANDWQHRLAAMLKQNYANCGMQVCLASISERGGMPEFQHIAMTRELGDEFRGIATDVLAKVGHDFEGGDIVLQTYNPGSKLDAHEIEWLDLNANIPIRSQIGRLEDLLAVDQFVASDDFVDGLRFYVIILQPTPGQPVYCFRTYSPKKEISRSAWLGMILSGNIYGRCEEKLFLFDQHIDCLVVGSDLFILNKDKFQRIFQFYEQVRQRARKTMAAICSRVPIANFAEFVAACEGHYQKMAKLQNISQKPYFSRITMNDIKKVIVKYSIGVEIVTNNGQEALVFNPSDKWGILRILDDGYLESLMTGEEYEVNSKRPL